MPFSPNVPDYGKRGCSISRDSSRCRFSKGMTTLAEPRRGHHNALGLYQDRRIRPPEAQLRLLKPEKQIIYRTAKDASSYWLGLLCYDMEKHDSALFWLEDRTLTCFSPRYLGFRGALQFGPDL